MRVVTSCDGCGKCCNNNWNISLKVADIKKLEKLGLNPYDFAECPGGRLRMKMNKGACLFLDEDNRCRIQKSYGYNAKPEVCKHFPYNDLVCGNFILTKKKAHKIKFSRADEFVVLGDKIIYAPIFSKILGNLDLEKDLFSSYCNLLLNALHQDVPFIYKEFKVLNYDFKISRAMKEYLYGILFIYSKNWAPRLRKRIGSNVTIKFPIKNAELHPEKREVPLKVKKEFAPYIQKNFLMRGSTKAYYLTDLLVDLYFLPFLLDPKKEEIDLIDVTRAFSLMNGLSVFSRKHYHYLALFNKDLKKVLVIKK